MAPFSVTLLLFFLASASEACRNEVLVTVRQPIEGVIVNLWNTNSNQVLHQVTIESQRLSSECGDNFFRCQNLLVEDYSIKNTQHIILFLPLEAGLAVVDLTQTQAGRPYKILRTRGAPDSISCSPSAVFKIQDGFFAVCTNKTSNFVSVFEVMLNRTHLNSTSMSYPLSYITVSASAGSVANISNFLHIESDVNHEYIVFGLGTAIYSLRPFIYYAMRLEDVRASACDRILTLSYRAGVQFYVHCSRHLFTYDLSEQDWLLLDRLDERGVPYSCPQPGTDLSVFSSYIEFTDSNNLHANVPLTGQAYNDGVCLGNESLSYFAFQDAAEGLFVLNLQSSMLVQFLQSSCGNPCYPLVSIQHRYLIVRSNATVSAWGQVKVLDFSGNQIKQIQSVRTSALLATLLVLQTCPQSNPAPPTDKPPAKGQNAVPEKKVESKKKSQAVLVSSVSIVVVVLIVFVSGSLAISLYCLRKHRLQSERLPTPVSESLAQYCGAKAGFSTEESKPGREMPFEQVSGLKEKVSPISPMPPMQEKETIGMEDVAEDVSMATEPDSVKSDGSEVSDKHPLLSK